MKEAFAKDIIPLLENGDLSEYVFKNEDGSLADDTLIISSEVDPDVFYKCVFFDGKLSNSEMDGRPFPAVEAPGLMEYRTNGVLTNVEVYGMEYPARICDGFNRREYWKNGKLIRVSEKSYDENDEPVWS